MPDPIKVLFLAADPFADSSPLRLDREARAIIEAMRRGRDRDSLAFVSEWAVRTGDLQAAVLRHRPQVVHFSGHGAGGRGIFLEDENGTPRSVKKEALGELFTILRSSIRVVVLNSCDSLPVIEAFRDVIDYTVGMSAPVTDRSAILFAEAFYGALAFGAMVEEAFALGVNRLRIEGMPEATIPILLSREGRDATPLAARTEPSPGAGPAPDSGSRAGAISSPVTLIGSTVGNITNASGDHAYIINNVGR
jgi:hypothetical protein